MTMTYTEAEAWLALEAKCPGLVQARTLWWIWQAIEQRTLAIRATPSAAA